MPIPESIDAKLRTALGFIVLFPGLILVSAGAALAALCGASQEQLHRFYVGFARLCILVGGTQLEVHGADRLRPGQPYVVVSNHESTWDPPAIIAALPGVLIRFIIKRQIITIPIFGHALRLTGNVRVERNQPAGDVERIREKMSQRADRVSMLFFAEGTRTRDGAMHSFKMGAFATAIAHGLPILPVAVAGTIRIVPPDRLRLRRGPVVIEVGEPIPVEGLGHDDRVALRDQGHVAVTKLRARARQRVRDLGSEPGGID